MGFHAGDHAFIIFRPRQDAPYELRHTKITTAVRNGNAVTYTFQYDGGTVTVPDSRVFKSQDEAEKTLSRLNNPSRPSSGREHPAERACISSIQTLLTQKRRQLRLTQKQVSDLAGISLRQYQRLESGERDIFNASYRSARAVFRVLGITEAELNSYFTGGF